MLKISQFGPITRFDLGRDFLGRSLYWTTCYWIDGLLIDTGCAHTAPGLLRALHATPIHTIVNTHTHEDHIGANACLQHQRPGLRILAHPQALSVLADPRHAQPLHPYRRLFWGWPEPSQADPLSEGEIVETEHYHLQVIYTPGHSSDHLCLFEAQQGWLFSGDLFVGGHDRAIRAGSDIWQIIASLKKVAALPLVALLPGSARLRTEPHKELSAKIEYLENLGNQILALHRQGLSDRQIQRTLLGGPMWIEFVTLGHFTRRHLLKSFLSLRR